MSDHLDPEDFPKLQPRGAPNQTVSGPKKVLPQPAPSPQPEASPSSLPESYSEILADFVKRFKIGDWSPDLDDIAERSPKRRALVIAINYEDNDPRVGVLRGVYIDARKIIHMLESKLGYDPEEICVLADIREPFSEEQGRPRWPSRENIHKAIAWLTHGTTPEDCRFLFVASHGHRQIRAQKEDGRPTFISNEGIMLREHEFIPFNQCDNCECQDREMFRKTFQETWCEPGGSKFIPEPQKVLYDFELNESLARFLGAGVKLTVVFDCCYSGGTLSKTLPGNVNATFVARGHLPESNEPSRISQLPESKVSKPFGNILCLPLQAGIGLEVPRARMTKSAVSGSRIANEAFISSCFSLTDIPAGRVDFHEECEVMCWAACRDIELAWGIENEEEMWGYGLFSKTFTDMFMFSQLPTYRQLNRHIQTTFNERNRMKKFWEEQNPRLFVSQNLASDEQRFASYLDSHVNF
ncbi:hypothetical protein BDV93DRAFT_527994 [Ceratobasidium sp. AG-I]|nr:hypothetical protein BDV93DRAFT_527994 [Ceratobasidium sp. AG-I]